MRLTAARLALVLTLVTPASALAQPFNPPTDYVYGMSSIDYAMWMFQRNDPYNTRQRVDLNLYGVTVAVDIMTNRAYVRIQADETVWCIDANTLVPFPEPGGDAPTCSFYTPGATGAITIDPVRRVMYSDGSANGLETDDCSDTVPNLQQEGQVRAFSIDPSNRGQLIDAIDDPGAGHSATDGNHLTFVPEEGVLWSACSEWTDNIRPRRIETGNISSRGGNFGALEITGLPTIMPASSIGVDPDGRRVFLIPWNPPTHRAPDGNTIADHPEAQHIHVYDMDTYAETDVLDYRTVPGDWDDNTHCGYNTDFKLYYDRLSGWLYETNFYEYRASFYDLASRAVYEPPYGGDNCSGHEGTGDCVFDLYGFDGPLPLSSYNLDADGDGIPTPVELGASDITLDPTLNDLDPRQTTDPDNPDTDGDGLNDGVEDANHNGRVDAGETNPADETDNPAGDYDGDGIPNAEDNCRAVPNPDQADADGNGRGDLCDGLDRDNDGIPDDTDNCDCVPNPDQNPDVCTPTDQDGDGAEDSVDNCVCLANPDQMDSNSDGFGDACSADRDGDTIPDAMDNCPDVANPDQADNCDADGTLGDACSPNADGDQFVDACDNCPERRERRPVHDLRGGRHGGRVCARPGR